MATEAGFISAFCRYDDEPIALEPYQLHFLENTSRFRWVTKARQVGYSFLVALEALARCHLRPKHTTVFVGYNLSDATEKILVARQVYEDLPLAFQKKLVTDSKMELAFESNSEKRGLSRIISHPSKAPRGKKGDVVLDELAHYVADREVYRGSTALIPSLLRAAHGVLHTPGAPRNLLGGRDPGASPLPPSLAPGGAVVVVPVLLPRREDRSARRPRHDDRGARRPVRQ